MSNNTYISPNLKRTSERINTNGDVINPDTKQIIKPIEPEYIEPVPQPGDLVGTINNHGKEEDKIPVYVEKKTSKIDEIISKKIEEIINKKVAEALEKL